MLKVFHGLYDRYFAEEEAIIFTLLIIAGLVISMTLGGVIAPLLWSLVISFVLKGLVNTLQRLGMPERVAVYLVYLLFLGLAVSFFFIFLPFAWGQLAVFLEELPSMIEQLRSLLLVLPEHYPEVFSESQVQQWLNSVQLEIRRIGQTILSHSVASITRLVTWLVYTILVPIMVFFMLKDSAKLLRWLESWLPERRPIMAQIWHEMNDQLANYIRGKALEILIVGGSTYIVFVVLGINYAFMLSAMVGLSVIVPFVGATVVTIPIFMVGFFQWGFAPELYQVMIAYAIIQMLDGNVLVPIIFSETVNLHPIAIITAILVFGGIWGMWGVFFAIPLATFLKAIINAWPRRSERPVLAVREETPPPAA